MNRELLWKVSVAVAIIGLVILVICFVQLSLGGKCNQTMSLTGVAMLFGGMIVGLFGRAPKTG